MKPQLNPIQTLPAPAINPTPPAQHSESGSTDRQVPAKDKPVRWYAKPEWATVWVTGLYTIIAGLTLFAIKRQADLMERQADEGRKSAIETTAIAKTAADAALLSAQSLINAERGVLIPAFDAPGKHIVFIECLNSGRSTVQITEIFSESILLKISDSLPKIPIYVSAPGVISQIEDWVAPGKSKMLGTGERIALSADLTDDFERELTAKGESLLWVYGIVVYHDGVSPGNRELRFCYAFWERVVGEPLACRVGGPIAYRQST